FTLGSDIYFPYVPNLMDVYAYPGNPLFIPEVRKEAVTAAYCLYAFGKHHAICYSPFGIEEISLPPEAIDKPPMELMIALNIDPSAFDIAGSKDYLARSYELVENLKPLLIEYRGKKSLQSYVRHSETDYGTFLEFENYNVQVSYAPRMPQKPVAGGMIFELTPNKFLLVGTMASMTFMPKPGEKAVVDLIKMEEGNFVNGEWVPGRILNGDEKMMIRHKDMPSCLMVELYKY
ncbi:MAG: DUF5597 domain-containing protein, partial [Agathobacter sp.]|nr:DUF5597 domain-containing protein [Agathobacter sp.]